jgi:alpha-glucuronidase
LNRHYAAGARSARSLQTRWETLRGKIDDERYEAVLGKLRQQSEEAAAWRDRILRYFGEMKTPKRETPYE